MVNSCGVDLLLNLAWALISCGVVLAWIVWRRGSDSRLVPELGRGLLIVGCISVLLFLAISISDDLAQAAVLAEGNKPQDVLKAPELRHLAVLLPLPL